MIMMRIVLGCLLSRTLNIWIWKLIGYYTSLMLHLCKVSTSKILSIDVEYEEDCRMFNIFVGKFHGAKIFQLSCKASEVGRSWNLSSMCRASKEPQQLPGYSLL